MAAAGGSGKGAGTLKPYLDAVAATLEASMCLQDFASMDVERHSKPEVEINSGKEVLLKPLIVARSPKEKVLIEPSINAVRLSIMIKQSDTLDSLLVSRFSRFLMQRAEDFVVMRRKAIEGYDISLLITSKQLEVHRRKKIVDFVVHFMADVDKEISAMKLAVNARMRLVATEFVKGFTEK